jgi:hypothetical protein
MKNVYVSSLLIAGSLALSGCHFGFGLGVGYTPQGSWEKGPLTGPRAVTSNRLEQAQYLSEDYDIRLQSAQTIISLVNNSQAKEELARLGLDVSDVSDVSEQKMPSADKIEKLAYALGERKEVVTSLIEDYLADQ